MRWIAVFAVSFIISFTAARAQSVVVHESLPEHLLYLEGRGIDPDATADERERLQQLYAARRRWENGQTLKVCFFGGGDSVRRLIAETAAVWSNYANLTFNFGASGQWRDCLAPSAGFSHIRIGFAESGYWSAVGSDSEKRLNNLQPSMNFAQFDLIYDPANYPVSNVVQSADIQDKATILHEFGHAIGLLHEHQNPELNCKDQIKWEGPNNVYDYFRGPPNHWNKATDEN